MSLNSLVIDESQRYSIAMGLLTFIYMIGVLVRKCLRMRSDDYYEMSNSGINIFTMFILMCSFMMTIMYVSDVIFIVVKN